MYVCMYVCMHACMYVCMCIIMYACMRACVHACMRACVHACMGAWVPARPPDRFVWAITYDSFVDTKAGHYNYITENYDNWGLHQTVDIILTDILLVMT